VVELEHDGGTDAHDHHHEHHHDADEVFTSFGRETVKKFTAAEIEKSLDFLNNYVIKHFADEEVLQKKYRYPDYPKHHQIHENLKKEIQAFIRDWMTNRDDVKMVKEVRVKVGDWLINHIKLMDTRLGAYIQGEIKK
jgi:hemerythrin-like metal-binding protein